LALLAYHGVPKEEDFKVWMTHAPSFVSLPKLALGFHGINKKSVSFCEMEDDPDDASFKHLCSMLPGASGGCLLYGGKYSHL
jgi:hypothetical protein